MILILCVLFNDDFIINWLAQIKIKMIFKIEKKINEIRNFILIK